MKFVKDQGLVFLGGVGVEVREKHTSQVKTGRVKNVQQGSQSGRGPFTFPSRLVLAPGLRSG